MGVEHAVVLLDLENAIGVNPGPELLASRLTAIRALAEPVAMCWAAYPTSLLSEPSRKVLKDHGVKTRWAKAGKNGADKALLDLARKEADKGHRRFVVVSADVDFAEIADLGTLEIIIREEQKINNRLKSRATKVHRLPGRSATTQATPRATGVAVAETPTSAGLVSEHRTGSGIDSGSATPTPSPRQLAAAGIGLWAAGVCVGAGVTVGSVLARRLLRE